MPLNPYKHQSCIEADVVITHGVSKLHVSMFCLIRLDVLLPQYEITQAALLNTVKSIEDLVLQAALNDPYPLPVVCRVEVNRQVLSYRS